MEDEACGAERGPLPIQASSREFHIRRRIGDVLGVVRARIG